MQFKVHPSQAARPMSRARSLVTSRSTSSHISLILTAYPPPCHMLLLFTAVQAAAKAGSKANEPRVISFYNHAVPAALPLDLDSLSPQQQQHLPRVQALLQQRPAWLLEALLDQLPGCNEEVLKPLLVALCYQFKTGNLPSLPFLPLLSSRLPPLSPLPDLRPPLPSPVLPSPHNQAPVPSLLICWSPPLNWSLP